MTKIDEFATQVGKDYKALSEIVDSLMGLHSLSMSSSESQSQSQSQSEAVSNITSQSISNSETANTEPSTGSGHENPPATLAGLKGYFFGDSLTEVNPRTTRGYVKWLKDNLGIEGVNKGVSSTAYTTRFFSEKFASDDIYDCDFIYIAMGVNDWWNVSKFNVPLVGPGGMKDLAGVSGFIYHTIKAAIFSTDGTRPVIVQTPLPVMIARDNAVQGGGYTLSELSNQIKSVVADLNKIFGNIYVMDMFSIDPLEVFSTSFDKDYMINNYYTQGGTPDIYGVHPNDSGWDRISPYIGEFLKKTLPSAINHNGYCVYKPSYKVDDSGKNVIEFSVLAYPTKEIRNTWYRFHFTQEIKDSKNVMYLYNLLNSHKYNIELTFKDGTTTSNLTKKLGEKWYSDVILYTEENNTDNDFYRKLFEDNDKIYTYDPDSSMVAYSYMQKSWWDSLYVRVRLVEK